MFAANIHALRLILLGVTTIFCFGGTNNRNNLATAQIFGRSFPRNVDIADISSSIVDIPNLDLDTEYIIWLDQEVVDDVKTAILEIVPEEFHDSITHVFVNFSSFSVRGIPPSVLQALLETGIVASIEEVCIC